MLHSGSLSQFSFQEVLQGTILSQWRELYQLDLPLGVAVWLPVDDALANMGGCLAPLTSPPNQSPSSSKTTTVVVSEGVPPVASA